MESDLLRSELAGLGLEQAADIDAAQVIIVNTCGFIREACEEGIDTVLEVDRLTRDRKPRPPVILLGCMGQRYGGELLENLPEVSGVLGVDWKDYLLEALAAVTEGKRFHRTSSVPEPCCTARNVDSSENATIFIRIADGCSRGCGFCTIPRIRGAYKSRSADDILDEVSRLTGGRDREIVLLAQDLTSYGTDTRSDTDLAGLLRMIAELEDVRWVRLLYLQPEGVTVELTDEIARNPKVCDYFDIPFQHASRDVLRRMGRPGDGKSYKRLISSIRKRSPGASLRTTLMVGYPGETEEDFEQLERFIMDIGFDWLGAFRFSPEPGTGAAELADQVPHDESVLRYYRILELQNSIEASRAARLIGSSTEVVIDGASQEEGYDFVGRSYREAPVIDGLLYLRRKTEIGRQATTGDFVNARITGLEGLDLVAEI
ncbi:MAG: 30S ribosomal protein S12 methylthiotransferase RimO [Actinobacteria bacterium]|nr:30S ribosomal protein S12 methylthiotransferase RimO [Actinomycetota bacterium]